MSNLNEDIERLMVRSLDGELGEDDELALNRELIRNPEARRLMAAYRAVDELSIAALGEVTAGAMPEFDAMVGPRTTPSKSRSRHIGTWFLLAPGAIAAALLALFVPKPSPMGMQNPPIVQAPSASTFNPLGTSPFIDGQRDLMRPVRSIPAIRRNTGREIIGVVGDDGNLYWIEVERTRTVTLPAESGSRATLNTL